MGPRKIRILSGVPRINGLQTERYVVDADYVCQEDTFANGMRLFGRARSCDLVLMNSSTRGLFGLCLMRWLLPFHGWRLVSLDIHLNEPKGWKEHLGTWLKRLLLRKVDLHILFFNDLTGYEKWFGVSAAKARFVPFKVNAWESFVRDYSGSDPGEYVFCGGRSLRDFETFKRAMAKVSCPGILLFQQDSAFMAQHGTPVDLSGVPQNVKVERHDGNDSTWIEYIRRAKIVVIPTFANSIYAPGLSLYLLAMGLYRCVIISEGPQTRGLLQREAIVVPPEDPEALAAAITKAWKDDAFRQQIACAGRQYAEKCGGENRMLLDIVNECGDLLYAARSAGGR